MNQLDGGRLRRLPSGSVRTFPFDLPAERFGRGNAAEVPRPSSDSPGERAGVGCATPERLQPRRLVRANRDRGSLPAVAAGSVK